MNQRRWSDLVPDVLREISSRLCFGSATDFVCFHAVCKPWRNSCDPLSRRKTTTQFPPCLLPAANNVSADLRLTCIFSNSCCRPLSPPPPPPGARSWVSSADGTEVRYLTVENLRPTLHDPFTGEFTRLPLFRYDVRVWEEKPSGIIYGDGTTFFYSFRNATDNTVRFRAALLRPGATQWTVVERILVVSRIRPEFCAAYHGGKIMVTVEGTLHRILALDGGDDGAKDVLVPLPKSMLLERKYYSRHYSFLVESRGELLWALIQVDIYRYPIRPKGEYLKYVVSFRLHVLEEETSTWEKKTRWVKKDGRSLADRVLFLGTPNSFAIDASRLRDQEGGCAYFVLYNFNTLKPEKVEVWRCNLISNKAEFVEQLPRRWDNERCT
jgi:hypothetical protein